MRTVWRELLWPARARHHAWRKNLLLGIVCKTDRFHFAWALPLFLVDDLLEPFLLYLALWSYAGRLGGRFGAAAARWAASGLAPGWRELRWAGPVRLVDISQGPVRLSLRLI